MLKLMRKHATGWMIKIILGAIIVVFVLYFGYGSMTEREDSVAQIGSYKIGKREYTDTYNKTRDFYKMLYKDNLDEKMLKELKLEDKVLEQLTDKYVLLTVADGLGLKIGDQEFADVLNGVPAFKKDGKFNKDLYVMVLKKNNLTPETFEEAQKQSLLMRKVAAVVQDTGTFFNESDIRAAYAKEKGMVKLGYVEFDPAAFKDKVTVSEKDLLSAYEKEKASFKGENTYQLKEFVIDTKGSLKDDQVYMDLLKSRDAEAYAKEKGLTVVDLKGARESELAKRFKDAKASEWFKGMKKGDISLPIREGAKSYIFQLVSVEEGKDLDKNLALARIKERIVAEKAKELAKQAAENAANSKSIDAKKETGFVYRNAKSIPGIGEIPQGFNGLLAVSKASPLYNKPVTIAGKFYVFTYKDEKIPDKEEWKKDEESYSKYFMTKNREEVLKSYMEEMRSKVKIKINKKAI